MGCLQFNQMLRFDIMLYLVDMTNMSVPDVGCGDGALFHYLSDQNINAEYKGIDVSKNGSASSSSLSWNQ